MRFPFGNKLLRTAMSLGFLGCLIAQETLYRQAATSESLIVTRKAAMGAAEATTGFCGNRVASNNADLPPPSAVYTGASCQGDALSCNGFDSMLTEQVEIGLPDDSVALEDSIELFRFDVQRRTFGVDRTVIGAKAALKVARNTRPSISPPLLV